MATNQRHYRILGLLGAGGFGKVYRAVFEGPYSWRKEVAIKRLLPMFDPEASQEFERRLRDEARILSMLKHRNIVVVDLLTRLDGDWCVVMELLPGLDLGSLVAQTGPLSTRAALEVITEAAAALAYALEARSPEGTPLRLIHRDIKPQNLMLSEDGGCKVLDFGIARAEYAGREAISDLHAMGTPLYMPPERKRGAEHERGDCYSLAAVLVGLLAGQPLGAAQVDPDAHRAMVEAGLRRLGASRPLPTALVELLAQSLASDPSTRPTAAELESRCRALAREADGEDLVSLARRVIPAQLARRARAVSPADPMIGRVLVEQVEDTIPVSGPVVGPLYSADAPLDPGRPRSEVWRLRRLGVGLGAVLVVAGALVAAVLASAAGLLYPTPAPRDPTPTEPVLAEPAPSLKLSVDAPAAASAPAPAPVRRASVTASPPGLMVELRGAVSVVVLPGRVAAGTYDAFATFRDVPEFAGTLVIPANRNVALDCSSALRSCVVRAR